MKCSSVIRKKSSCSLRCHAPHSKEIITGSSIADKCFYNSFMRQAKIYVTEKASALRTGFNLYQVRLKSGSFTMADIMNTDKLEGGKHLSKG